MSNSSSFSTIPSLANYSKIENGKSSSILVASHPLQRFKYALKAKESKRQYPKRLKVFLDFLDLGISNLEEQSLLFYEKAKQNTDWAEESLILFAIHQKSRIDSGEISDSTVQNYFKATKLFCEMNNLRLNWKMVKRGLPSARHAANDRAPTLEEIQKLIQYPDRRVRVIASVMAPSGIRVGAWDFLKWKHVEPIKDENNSIVAAKLVIYPGDREQYYTFITSEAYHILKEWMEFRAAYGEQISNESWLMRDIWQTTNIRQATRLGLATSPKRLESSAITRLLNRALQAQGLRKILQNGGKRHEFKAAHGFRKFYKSRAEQVMRPANVEILMGHSIGTSDSYYKPTEKEVLGDYLKAVDLLVLNSDKTLLKKHVQKLEEQNKNNEYIIKGRLQEKDEQIKNLTEQFTTLKSMVEKLASGLGNIPEQQSVNDIARSMYISGMLKPKDG